MSFITIFKFIWNLHYLVSTHFFIRTINFWAFSCCRRSIKTSNQLRLSIKMSNQLRSPKIILTVTSYSDSFWYFGSAWYLILPFTLHKIEPAAPKIHHTEHKIQPTTPKIHHTYSPMPKLTSSWPFNSVASNSIEKTKSHNTHSPTSKLAALWAVDSIPSVDHLNNQQQVSWKTETTDTNETIFYCFPNNNHSHQHFLQ